MKRILFIFLLLPFFSFSQDSTLSKQQMYKDFDYLTDTVIKSSYARLDAMQTITKQNILEEYKKMRTEIDSIHNEQEFAYLIQEALNLTEDGHCNISSTNEFQYIIPYLFAEEREGFFNQIDTNFLDVAKKRYKQYRDYYIKQMGDYHFFILSKYIAGKYYNILPIKYNGIVIDKAWEIVKCNGIDINTWVNTHLRDYQMCHYDTVNERFYTNRFFLGKSIASRKDSINLTFKSKTGQTYDTKFSLHKRPKFIGDRWITINLTHVKYFRKDKVLFIRLYSMDESKNYLKKIRKIARKKQIDRVIIDIRYNGGGSDLVWKEILEELIDQPIRNNLSVAINNSTYVKKYLGLKDTLNPVVSFLGKNYLKLDSRDLEVFLPSTTSIRFSGKIIILQNKYIFSSAAALSAIASYSDKLVTVGEANGYLGGVGITPIYFMLPESKTVIRIDPTIDLTNASKPTDVLNKVEVPVEYSVDNYHRWLLKNGSRWNRHFLYNNDPIYRKALEIDVHPNKYK